MRYVLIPGVDHAAHARVVVGEGEASKTYAGLEQVSEALIAAKIERNDLVVALGGGVVGDLAGFASSILRRGVDFVQVPTSLLAQVDSSVGGKTGINSPQGKNLLGAFHQPVLVIADTAVLSSSPVVLIDEIENAGVDRKRALDLLGPEHPYVRRALDGRTPTQAAEALVRGTRLGERAERELLAHESDINHVCRPVQLLRRAEDFALDAVGDHDMVTYFYGVHNKFPIDD